MNAFNSSQARANKVNEHLRCIDNERGSVIVVAMIVLVLLTLIGISSTDNTVVENAIVRSEAFYRQNFYKSEGAIVELAQFMERNDISSPATYDWLTDSTAALDMTDPSNWTWTGAGAYNSQLSNNMDASDGANVTLQAAVANGVAPGSSLEMTSGSSLYDYMVYGLFESTANQGRKLVAAGYRKRF